MDSREDILRRDFSEEFITKMKNSIEVSHHKYGWMSNTYPELAQAVKCIRERLEIYEKTHNKDYLIDIANFAMIEYKFPSFNDAKYEPGDSDQSPGLAGGTSYKQMLDEIEK